MGTLKARASRRTWKLPLHNVVVESTNFVSVGGLCFLSSFPRAHKWYVLHTSVLDVLTPIKAWLLQPHQQHTSFRGPMVTIMTLRSHKPFQWSSRLCCMEGSSFRRTQPGTKHGCPPDMLIYLEVRNAFLQFKTPSTPSHTESSVSLEWHLHALCVENAKNKCL